jgi:putative membrane protein
MKILISLLTGFIALEHLFFLWLEMFAWETKGKQAFKGALPAELFKPTKTLAANQGLYNGFLAAGLIWTFGIHDPVWKTNISIFFLSCICIAGIYGGITASKKIFFIQAMPAILALIALCFA